MKIAKKTEYDYNSFFPSMLRNLMEQQNQTQESVAKSCGVQRQTIGQWMNGNTMPDILSLKKLAIHFGVSSDYLLGLSDVPATDANWKAACEYTGLSHVAIATIRVQTEAEKCLKEADAQGACGTLSKILENENFWDIYRTILVATQNDHLLSHSIEGLLNTALAAEKRLEEHRTLLFSTTIKGLAPLYKYEISEHAAHLFDEILNLNGEEE